MKCPKCGKEFSDTVARIHIPLCDYKVEVKTEPVKIDNIYDIPDTVRGMREYATKNGIVIPRGITKKDEIKECIVKSLNK